MKICSPLNTCVDAEGAEDEAGKRPVPPSLRLETLTRITRSAEEVGACPGEIVLGEDEVFVVDDIAARWEMQ